MIPLRDPGIAYRLLVYLFTRPCLWLAGVWAEGHFGVEMVVCLPDNYFILLNLFEVMMTWWFIRVDVR
jgi:hypothetical protein